MSIAFHSTRNMGTAPMFAAILLLLPHGDSALPIRADQTVVIGRVTDASGSSIEQAQIVVQERSISATSGTDGRYVMRLARSGTRQQVTLMARRTGYESQRVMLLLSADTVHADFRMVASTTRLESVVVTSAGEARDSQRSRVDATASAVAKGMVGAAPVGSAPQMNRAIGSYLPKTARYDARPYLVGHRAAHADSGNTEAYDHIDENPFRSPAVAPMSTFSVDVDRASYSNVRRFVAQGQLPPKDAVRIEELLNYFPYGDPAPDSHGAPLRISTEVAAAPWNTQHDLVRIAVKAREVEMRNAPASNLVFLIDVSGSMYGPGRLPLVKQSLGLVVNELREEDRVAIVVYAGNAGLVLPSTSGASKQKILAALDGLEAGGSTAGGAGIALAYDVARQHFIAGGNNRVILCTDGDFNVGQSSDGELVRLIEQRRREGSYLTILGFGMGNYKDSKMEKLSGAGNGNYGYVDDLLEARKLLVKEMGGTLVTVAKDVKLQVEFNPARVQAYRLLGYEDRLLRDEDFTNDARDAGDVGAGHTVTALYEIVRTGAPLDVTLPGVSPLRYQKVEGKAAPADELLHVALRYKAPDGEKSALITQPVRATRSSASESMRFAASVAGFGMLLRESENRGSLTWDQQIALARGAKGDDEDGYRADFIRLSESAARLAGKRAVCHPERSEGSAPCLAR